MNNELVTLIGGGGFLGRYVAQALLQAGARVRVAQRDPRQAFFLKPLGGLGQTQFVAADVTRPDTIVRAVQGASAVVNLVGVFGKDQQRVHVDGARAVAEAAQDEGAALVHISAIGADAAGDSAYARTKGAGEGAVRAAAPDATFLRPSTVFGREDQFINRFAQMIATLPVVPVLRAGARFQPVYAADVAHAVLRAITDPTTFGGRTFELGGPEMLTMLELHQRIAAHIGRSPHFAALPDALGGLIASIPGTPISADQWKMLQHDNVVAPHAEGLAALGITPTPLDSVAPGWLVRFRKTGRFGMLNSAA
ncbi:complex I NDUFA9 subunit family protein [Sphingomonas ginsenosidimutans]|jgi:NADH dehydrogenase|uniref:Complex I NDUFA9 subunit family protein n=1 Tax=Sphingomonas ginsenosidimutans TaxID=862134 RepID=A0A2A4HZF7_9SPHN|nr:complex I NDUFA9 subunit family protein [Sphingomonas ginsenosidimutans]PCG09373.1 complex I NDUFA9 subunit family protein [Sphingomonas ginsenosidimutans]